MFTGIVNKKIQIAEWNQQQDLVTLALDLDEQMLNSLKIGASVGLNGTCLTFQSVSVVTEVAGGQLRLTRLPTQKMAAQRFSATVLDGSHHFQLCQIDMPSTCRTPGFAIDTKGIWRFKR